MADILIVGAGFSGSVIARQLADAGHTIKIIDKRQHIGGNAFDFVNEHGIRIHKYGPHLFHTNSDKIFNYLSNYTQWSNYEHRVLSEVGGVKYPFPVNKTTINKMYGLNLDEPGVIEFIHSKKIHFEKVSNSEDLILSTLGQDLYEKFYLNYTLKQWALSPKQLKVGVAARIPVRTNDDDRYFTDNHQAMPSEGYTQLFENLLNHKRIEVCTNQCFFEITDQDQFTHIVYSGPIDKYFNYVFGKLPYRSLNFEHSFLPNTEWYQEVGTVNYPNDHAYTRITEFKHFEPLKRCAGTSIVKEFPTDQGDPYYPIPTRENEAQYKKYFEKAKQCSNVSFVGRLAQYKYYNMDQVVGAALSASEDLIKKLK